jgi:tetratricopeptide (TPR) repeat protein
MNDARVPFPAALEERYKNPRFIGAGGASTVYAAHDKNLVKDVAIKILGPRASGHKLLRFQQEAKVIGKLSHANIVTAIDFGVVDENFAYLVMDLVGEESLQMLIERRENLPVRKCIDIFQQVATAMQYAHSQGVLHRDLKPGNVLLDEPMSHSPRAKVADFGVAKIAGVPFFVTTGSIFIGTPNYMSPEQFRAEDVDQRSDIYSFGCLMFETLTGEVPFPGTVSTELAQMHANNPVPPLTATTCGEDIPESLQHVVRRCLSKDPADRYSTFAEIDDRLKQIASRDTLTLRRVPQDKDGLAPREPYLVSSQSAQLPIADSAATKKVLAAIVSLVVVIGALICVSLMGWGPSFSGLIPDGKEAADNTALTTSAVEPTSSPLHQSTEEITEKLNEAHAEREAWRNRDVKLPASMLDGTAEELIAKAKKQMDKKRYNVATSFLDRVLERDPNNVKALKMRSDALRYRSDYAAALSDITAATSLRPNDAALIFKRAILRRETNDLNGALDDCTAAIQLEPSNQKYVRERGDVYSELGKPKEAFADYDRSIRIEPSEAALRNRGKLYQINGKFNEAIEDYTKAIAVNPGSAELRYLRGNSYNQTRQYKKAIADYSVAIGLNGGNADFYKMRAAAYEQVGDTDKARKDRATSIDDFQIGK